MAFIPREEYVPRRGVAMKVMELPSPLVKIPQHRDLFIDQVADHFHHQDFILNRALNDNHIRVSKVKTYKRGEVFAATGNGNIMAPTPEPTVVHAKHYGVLDDRILEKIYKSPAKDRERRNDQILMEDAHGIFEHMTQPHAERRHRLPGPSHDAPVDANRPKKEVMGFEGLGRQMIDKPEGKGRGTHSEPFDPLGFRRYQAPERAQGIKKSGKALVSEVGQVIKHDDNVPLLYQRSPLRAHHHTMPVHFSSPEHDIPGFKALGASDEPWRARVSKLKGPSPDFAPIDHDYRIGDHAMMASPAAAQRQQQRSFDAASRYPYNQSRTPAV